ncbi:MAG TPA: rhomboid family intramembrane serine protease [Verrucomicrobiae bacterium]|nr:rhomboid family intramembrane serine protease [Verrucomicrobiae bacterium]
MRQSPFDARRSITVLLLMVNVAVFVLQLALQQFTSFPVNDYFALSLDGLKHGYVWQLITYEFMHVGVLHLLFNCWAIYVFGQEVEEALGRKAFVALYFSSGIIGGLVQTLAGLFLGRWFAAPVLGASAAAFGLVAAFALLFPDRVILLFFIIPIRAKYLLVLCGVLVVIGLLSPENSTTGVHIADAAHLGGMLTGLAFVRYAMHWNFHWPRLRRVGTQTPRRLVKVGSSSSGRWSRSKTEEELPRDEFLSKEVDPILDKISAHGIQSLTERERGILEAAREKIRR